MTEREALNMALQALETLMIERGSIYDKATTAIKEALMSGTDGAQPEPNYKKALEVWLDKTEWVQKTVKPHELGMHRADVLKQRIEEALAQPEQHQDWCASLTQMLMSMPPKPAPCNCKPKQEPVAFEEWLSNQHGDPEEIGFLQALRIAYISGQDSITTPPQRKPLTDEEIWVLTSEYNDYDQHGEYFEAVFIGKPTAKQIQKHCLVGEKGAVHILNGGGRVKYEDQWYNLRKEKAAHGIKELV